MFEQSIRISSAQARQKAKDDANQWRAQCIEYFARMEAAMGATLRVLEQELAKDGVRDEQNVGKKICALLSVTTAGGLFPNPKLHRTLNHLHGLRDRRNLLVHARSTVKRNPAGEWQWTGLFRRWGETEDFEHTISRPEAYALEADLKLLEQSLRDQLRALRRSACR